MNDWPCNCLYKDDPYKAPELHAMTCPVWLLSEVRWFDGDGSEFYFGAGHQDKAEFAAFINEDADSQLDSVEAHDVEHVWAIPTSEERFKTVTERVDGAVPITRCQP